MKIALVPIYNENSTLISVLDSVDRWADHIVIVDDGSVDGSSATAQEWEHRHSKKTSFIHLEQNQGMATALKAGLLRLAQELASEVWRPDDLLVLVDADNQYGDADPLKLCAYLEEKQCDLMIVQRDFSLYPSYKRLGNRLLSGWASWMSGQKINDIEAGLRVLRLKLLPAVLEYYTGWRYSCSQEVGIIAILLGFKVDNEYIQPISYYRSRTRISHFLINAWMGFVCSLRVRTGWKVKPISFF